MIAIREHGASPRRALGTQRHCIDSPRRRDLESLDVPRQRCFVLRLHDQMEVGPLHADMGDSKVISIGDQLRSLLDRKVGISPAQISDAAGRAQYHMYRVPIDELCPLPMTCARTRSIRLASSTPSLPTSAAKQSELLYFATRHNSTLAIIPLPAN